MFGAVRWLSVGLWPIRMGDRARITGVVCCCKVFAGGTAVGGLLLRGPRKTRMAGDWGSVLPRMPVEVPCCGIVVAGFVVLA